MTYNGKCHCGKIAFDVEGELTEIIECNCSICYESGYLHWMIDPSQLRIKTPLKAASIYQWGTGQALDTTFFAQNAVWRFCVTPALHPILNFRSMSAVLLGLTSRS